MNELDKLTEAINAGNQMTKWYRWPEDKQKGLVPWFVILRRLIFWPLLAFGMALAVLAVAGGFGISEARRFWRDAL